MIAIEMQMPQTCDSCRFASLYGFCNAMPRGEAMECYFGLTRPDWCPLIRVEKCMSERLFDENELAKYPDEAVERYTKDALIRQLVGFLADNNVVTFTSMKEHEPFRHIRFRVTLNVALPSEERQVDEL